MRRMVGPGENELDERLNNLLTQRDIRLIKKASEFFLQMPIVNCSLSIIMSTSENKESPSDF